MSRSRALHRGEHEPILTRQLFEAVQAKRVPAQDAHSMSAKQSADAVDSRRRTLGPEGRPRTALSRLTLPDCGVHVGQIRADLDG
jgi:hypothetical protein